MVIKNAEEIVSSHFCKEGKEYFNLLVNKKKIRFTKDGNINISKDNILKLFKSYRRKYKQDYDYANELAMLMKFFGMEHTHFYSKAYELGITDNPKESDILFKQLVRRNG